MKKLLLSSFLLVFCLAVFAAKVETVSTYSKVMNKEIKAVVVTPDNYSTAKRLPVIYLLHGYGGDYHHFVKVSLYRGSARINLKTIGIFNEVLDDFDL